MVVQVDDLIKQVKVNMEELTDSQVPLVEMAVGVDVESYIRAKLPDALMAVWSMLPLSSLPCIDCATSLTPIVRENGNGLVYLPDDLCRLIEFRMVGWKRPVTTFLSLDSPEYELQYNPYTRGGKSTPVCTLFNLDGRKCLEYYPLSQGDTEVKVESAVYVPYPDVNADSYDLPPERIPTLCYMCAAMVYEILGQPDLAAAMLRGVVQ